MPLVCPGHSRGIVQLEYSPVTVDGYFLISACLDGYPMLRDGATGNWLGTFHGHKGAVWSASLNNTATLAVTGGADFTCRIWNALNGLCLRTYSQPHICRAVSFSEDSTKVLVGGNMKTLSIFDLLGGQQTEPLTVLEGHTSVVRFAGFFGEGHKLIVSGGDEPFLYIWDTRSGKLVNKLDLDAHCIKSAEISSTGSFTKLTAVTGNSLQFWDLNQLCRMDTMSISQDAECASSSGNHVVVGGRDLQIRLYDTNTKQVLHTFHGHHGPVWCVRFSPLGDGFASGSDDGTIRLWKDEYFLSSTSSSSNAAIVN
ncbi:hypothetical protein GAYE_SCF05G2559 [Galdieria yellowstonensis]|uniref:Serine-threonine kinase receptor-associated protein n=1 Tax=Galdieria yellowstonensis TaxID=3028027 RepID=A0AAV9IBG2_9RHOD|nr:hypothetical protein GAYE_SCF05G2559 [Galdieria yellowstonensis]